MYDNDIIPNSKSLYKNKDGIFNTLVYVFLVFINWIFRSIIGTILLILITINIPFYFVMFLISQESAKTKTEAIIKYILGLPLSLSFYYSMYMLGIHT